MAFKEAKQIIEDKVEKKVQDSPETTMRKVTLRASYAYTKEKMQQVVDKTSSYIDKVYYKGNKQDKRNYLAEVKHATNILIKDDKVMLAEFRTYQNTLHTKTDNLEKRIVLQQRAAEELAFQNLKKITTNILLMQILNIS